MNNPSLYQAVSPTCPHCGHVMDDEDRQRVTSEDLYALAPREGSAVVSCPQCTKEYAVQGGYRPHYTSALSIDDL